MLSTEALRLGEIEVVGYGRSHLTVASLDGSVQASVDVYVMPPKPVMINVEPLAGSPGTFEITAYRADALSDHPIRVGGQPVRTSQVIDSTKIQFSVAEAVVSGCAGTSIQPVTVAGVQSIRDLHVDLQREDAIRLSVGEMMRLQPRTDHCLHFTPLPDARYIAAFVDMSALDAYRNERMPYHAENWERVGGASESLLSMASRPTLDPQGGSIATSRLLGFPSFSGVLGARRAAETDIERIPLSDSRRGIVPTGSFDPTSGITTLALGTPTEIGQVIAVRGRVCHSTRGAECVNQSSRAVAARIVKVYGSQFAVAVPTEVDQAVWLATTFPALDERIERLDVPAIFDYYARVFGVAQPISEIGRDVLVMLAGNGVSGSFAIGNADHCSIQIEGSGQIDIMAHEIAHCFQFSAAPAELATAWGLEGGAEVAAQQFLRSKMGQGLDDNTPQRSFGTDVPGTGSYPHPFAGIVGDPIGPAPGAFVGVWARGYGATAAILNDWIAQLHGQSGVSEEDAVSAILLGALEQGYGAGTALGLVGRIRALNAGFDPSEEALVSVIRHRTDHVSSLTNPRLHMNWIDADPLLFPPSRDLFARLAGDQPAAREMTLPHSAYGLAEFSDPGVGATIQIRDAAARFDWMLVRIE